MTSWGRQFKFSDAISETFFLCSSSSFLILISNQRLGDSACLLDLKRPPQVVHLAIIDDLAVLQLPDENPRRYANLLGEGDDGITVAAVEAPDKLSVLGGGHQELGGPVIGFILFGDAGAALAELNVDIDLLPTVEQQMRALVEEREPEMIIALVATGLL